MDIRKTNKLDMFIRRADNRKQVDKNHVENLIESIKEKNWLAAKPILVNERMEVLDGNHRLAAAKALKLDVYYIVIKDSEAKDIMLLNTHQKNWGMVDVLNFYCKNGNREYQKLEEFMKKHNINLKIALSLTCGRNIAFRDGFRAGEYKFEMDETTSEEIINRCWETVDFVKMVNGSNNTAFLNSGRFWSALARLFGNEDFQLKAWDMNLKRFAHKILPKATLKDYLVLLEQIHNYKQKNKIALTVEDEELVEV